MTIRETIKKSRCVGIFALMLALSFTAKAQHYVGVRGGFGMGYGRFEPLSQYANSQVWGLWSGGLQWKYYGPEKYIGAVGAEIEFIQRGYKYATSLNSANYTSRVVNSVNIPIIWHIHMNMPNNKFRVFLNLGVWGSYNFPKSYETIMTDGVITTRPYSYSFVKDNPFGYGLLGGAGFNVVFDKWEMLVEGRYYFSYGDILRNNTVYAGNPVRSPLDNVSLSIGFFYRLGNIPHTPAPSKAYLRKMERKAAEKKKQSINDNSNGIDKTEQSSQANTERR